MLRSKHDEKAPPLRWFWLIINFTLYASALMHLGNGISAITGAHHKVDTEKLYRLYPAIKTLDIGCGIFLILLSVFIIYTRFRLAHFRRRAPLLLAFTYLSVCLHDVVYFTAAVIILPHPYDTELNLFSFGFGVANAVILLIIDHIYFKKREHLFIK
jgi:hypothetical protein